MGVGTEPPGRMGPVRRWDEGALRGGMSRDLNHASEGLVLRGECQPLQLTCPRRGPPVEPTSWEPFSPQQVWKGALSVWELAVIPSGGRGTSFSGRLALSHTEKYPSGHL